MSHGDSQAAPVEVEPNAPSAPQWSLSEQRVEARAVARNPEPERVSSQESFAPKVSEAAVETAEPETDEPREARKGWWQRRFKI